MALRRADVCSVCTTALPVGVTAGWDRTTSTVSCVACLDGVVPGAAPTVLPAARVPDVGGGSAQREHDRRSARREQRVQRAHPRLGRLLLSLTSDPTSTRVWAQGAAGERAVAAKLDGLSDVAVLHDRLLRRPDGRLSRGNVDHLAVAASGVWVIDAKTHSGALEVRRSGGLLTPRVERLRIGGRDRSSLVEGLRSQVVAVAAQLEQAGVAVPVRGALCFVGTELPWFGSSRIGEVPLVGRRGLGKLLAAPGELEPQEREVVAQYLHERFPPAT